MTSFLLCWATSFVSLAAAVLLLLVYYRVLWSDLPLKGLRAELLIALFASAAGGGVLWFVLSTVGRSFRRESVASVAVVYIIYRFAHYDDWEQYDFFGLLAFQSIILIAGSFVYAGQPHVAAAMLAAFLMVLLLIGAMFRSD